MVFSEGVITLSGPAGRIDERLGGEAGRLISGGNLTGSWESQALLASEGRVASEFVLFAGMGALRRLSPREMSIRMEKVVQRAAKLSARSMAAFVPSEGPWGEFGSLAAETVGGALRGVSGCPYDVDLIFCEPDAGRYEELVAASERIVFRRVKGREVSLEVIV